MAAVDNPRTSFGDGRTAKGGEAFIVCEMAVRVTLSVGVLSTSSESPFLKSQRLGIGLGGPQRLWLTGAGMAVPGLFEDVRALHGCDRARSLPQTRGPWVRSHSRELDQHGEDQDLADWLVDEGGSCFFSIGSPDRVREKPADQGSE